jgi:hypothetical protein
VSDGLQMLKMTASLALAGAIFALAFGAALAAPTGPESPSPIAPDSANGKRPRVTIYPRRQYPGPYAVRQCRSWLVTEYRVSGPVITPQMRCWWQ